MGEIRAKNRLWHDCWKTMNWAFAYSDRTEQPFGKGIGDHPPMAKELERYKPLLRKADERIHPDLRSTVDEGVVQKQPPPQPPVEEQKTFKVRDGFDVNLFAGEADGLVKPLSMRWDERGRLWAACSPSYPQLVPGEPHSDYILVCEDTNADGKADKFHKFADGLTMPMGIEFAADGGVYVCESTQLALFRDMDGNGVSDEREVILSGFGTGDSHQMINSLRWGPDGCLWFSQGLHIFSRIETPWGIVRFDRAGLWRFNPRTWKLQGFFGNAAAGANCWGVTFDDWGQVFHCAADNNPGFYTTPGLGTWPNPPPYYNIGALAVSPVKGMCMEFINSTHLPPELQGVLCKPVYFANQLLLYKLVEDGSGFKTEDLGTLLTSSSNAFRPLGVQTGPDGALYVCDWYNPVIGHYQASYRDPRRDKIHGRIWRVSAKGRPLTKRPELEIMRPEELVDQLRSPERWVRDQARRLLFANRAQDISAEFQLPADDAAPAFLYEVLATQAGQGEVNTPLLRRCLAHDDARLRAFAVRVWSLDESAKDHSESPDDEEYAMKLLANAVNDRHPRVRLEAAVAAGYFKDPVAVELALGVLDHPRDRFIDYALANTIRATKPVWAPALETGRMTFEGNAAHLAFLLQTDGAQNLSALLKNLLAKEDLSGDARAVFRSLLINGGSPEDVLSVMTGSAPTPQLLEAFAARVPSLPGLTLPDEFKRMLGELLQSTDSEMRGAALQVVRASKAGEFRARVREMAVELSEAPAVAVLAALAGQEALPDLLQLTKEGTKPDVQAAAVTALTDLDLNKAAECAAELLSRDGGPAPAELLGAFLPHARGAAALTTSISAKPPARETAGALLAALATAGRSDAELVSVLRKAAGLLDTVGFPDYSPSLVTQLITDANARGDAKRGGDVFMAAQAACIGCHKVGETGGITGPDLTAIGRGMTPELITESVLWPKRQIKEGFFLTTVTTHDGKILTGYKQSEDAKSLALRAPGVNATDTIAKAQIKDRNDTGTLMPENLTGWMTDQQRLDLLRYLFELGK